MEIRFRNECPRCGGVLEYGLKVCMRCVGKRRKLERKVLGCMVCGGGVLAILALFVKALVEGVR